MRCKDCGGEVPVLREFCPNCGAPTDPSLRERLTGPARGTRGDDAPTNRGKGLWIAAAALLGLGIVGNNLDFGGDGDDRPVIGVAEQSRGAITIESEQLFQAYLSDPREAANRFREREMVVSGEFVRIVPDGYGSLDLRLKTTVPGAELGIDLADLAVEDGKSLRPGQRVTVSCQRMGDGGEELWVQDCAIQPTAETATAPEPSAADPADSAAPAADETR